MQERRIIWRPEDEPLAKEEVLALAKEVRKGFQQRSGAAAEDRNLLNDSADPRIELSVIWDGPGAIPESEWSLLLHRLETEGIRLRLREPVEVVEGAL